MGNHALLSPSSSHRWLSCTPSAVLETEFENKSSNAAEEGTAFHALCEHKLKKALRRRSKRPVSAFNTDEMEEHSDGYVEFVLEQLEKAKQTCPDPLVLIEQKVDLSDFVPGSYGTADCLMASDDTLHIIDAKYGLGVFVDNEKYIGDALLQKTYTVDFLEKKRVPNNGLVPQYYVENSHEAIIPRDLYMQVQEEMIRRSNLHSGKNRKKRVYSSKYALSSIVYCSKCGEIYRRVVWNNRGNKSVVWRCCTRMENGPGTCDADAIHESELQSLVIRAINRVLARKDTMNEALQKNVEEVLNGADGIPLAEIDSRLEELQKELLKVANSKGNYDSIADEIYRLREARQSALVDNAEREGVKQRISEMQQFLAEQTQDITEYDEQLVRRLIEKITVYEEKVTVEFKSGTSLDVRR